MGGYRGGISRVLRRPLPCTCRRTQWCPHHMEYPIRAPNEHRARCMRAKVLHTPGIHTQGRRGGGMKLYYYVPACGEATPCPRTEGHSHSAVV
eukprot:1460799-Pyramimonas_sp.AAC.1